MVPYLHFIYESGIQSAKYLNAVLAHFYKYIAEHEEVGYRPCIFTAPGDLEPSWLLGYFIPVSYTHLDVYKRQEL